MMLFILSFALGYGGAERSVETILRHLPAGISVRIYVEAPEHIDRLSQPGALPSGSTMIRVSTRTLNGRRSAAIRLVADYLRYRPTALLLNTNASAIVAAKAAKFLPHLGRSAHLYIRDFGWNQLDFIFSRLRKVRVVVPSLAVLDRPDYLLPFLSSPDVASRSTVIPDMTDLPSGDVGYNGPILHLATINPWKGHRELMMAVHSLRQRGVPIRVASHGVMGDRLLRDQLVAFAAELGIGDCFFLGHYLADPAPNLRDCLAVVVASVSHSGGPETFGRTVIEAWAYRKPVVAFAAGAPARIISHDVDGLLVPEGDHEALAIALQRLMASPELCRRLGEAGHAKVLNAYESGHVTRRLLDYLGL